MRRIPAHAIPVALVAAAFAHGLATSWRKWGNLFVDGGREMELPRRLVEGGVLYQTVRNLYGPLPAWVNAALFSVFGIHLDVLVAAGVLSAAVMTIAVYALAGRFMGRWLAALVAGWFVEVSAFGHLVPNPSFNFVIPYAYAATYGITAATVSLFFAVRHLQLGRDRDLGISLVFASAAALCKIEAALAVASAHGVILAGELAAGLLTRRRLLLYGAALAGVLSVYGVLTLRVGSGLWSDNIFSAANTSIAVYARETMGLRDVGASLRAVLESAVAMAAAILAGWGSARLLGSPDRRRRAAGVAVAISAAALLLAVGARSSIDVSLRALPLLALLAFGAMAVAFARDAERRPAILAHLALWAFALACLSRLLLRTVPYHYGFYLVPVPVLAAATVLTGGPSSLLRLRPWPRPSALPAAGLLAGIALACFLVSRSYYAMHTATIESPRGTLVTMPDPVTTPALDFLSRLPPDAKVIAVPIGTGLVFLSGRHWGDYGFSYFPTDVIGRADDPSLVRRWSADPPDAVLYFPFDMGEFGYLGFGVDYGRHAVAWLQANYASVSDPRLQVVFLVRRRGATEGRPAE